MEYRSGSERVAIGRGDAPLGVQMKRPGSDWASVPFETVRGEKNEAEFGPVQLGALTLRWRLIQKGPALVERVLEAQAAEPVQAAFQFPIDFDVSGEFA